MNWYLLPIIVFSVILILSGCLDNIQGRDPSNLPQTIEQQGVLIVPDSLSLGSQKVVSKAKIYVVPSSQLSLSNLKISEKYPYVLTNDKGEFKIPAISTEDKYHLLADVNNDGIADGYILNFTPSEHLIYFYVLTTKTTSNVVAIYPQKYIFEPGEVVNFNIFAAGSGSGDYQVEVRAWKDDLFYPIWRSETATLSGNTLERSFTWNMPSTIDPTYSSNGYVRWYAFLKKDGEDIGATYFIINATQPGKDIISDISYDFTLSPETVTTSPEIAITPSVSSDDIKFFMISNYADFSTYEVFPLVNGKAQKWELLSDEDGLKTLYFKLMDKNGNISKELISKTIFLDRTPPTKPEILGQKNLTALSVNLSFSFSENGKISNIYLYKVASDTELTDFSPEASNLLATLTQNSYQDTDIISGKNYYYKVQVEDWAGNKSSFSDIFHTAYRNIVFGVSGGTKKQIGLINSNGTALLTAEITFISHPYISDVIFSQNKTNILLLASDGDYNSGNDRNIFEVSAADLQYLQRYDFSGDISFIRAAFSEESFIFTLNKGFSHDIYFIQSGNAIPTLFLATPQTDEVAACWNVDGDKIAFQTDANKIYIINADGTGIRYLVDGKLADWQPARQILYQDLAGNICSINEDGTLQQTLILDGDSPRWILEDGIVTGILFRRKVDGVYQIMLANVDGSNIRQITTGNNDKVAGGYR